ncbi:uncharacterized protein [Sinocyclocheilus grahami]|uniref:uncharacterized protein n=1 Tax=Sinocyclocheilus grahami TaxID=75366 RepID=UPI0007AD4040|nr:PREDICTED: uncharacterized protein LOC107573283 [Sinocyclocheilus grahami]
MCLTLRIQVIQDTYLASGNSVRTLAFHYRMGESTVAKAIKDTCAAINRYLASGNSVRTLAFHYRMGESTVAKAIKDTLLLAVVDAEYRFCLVHIGEYGRSSDGGVFAGSAIRQALDAKKLEVPDDQQLPGAEHLGNMPFTIVGDAAFPLKTYLMRPYPGLDISTQQRIVNYRLSRVRNVVENAFGILSSHWRILMKSKPTLRFEAGELVLRASKQAATVEKVHLSQVAEGVPFVPKDPEAVLEEAKVRVVQGGGCPFDDLLLASQSAIQFGHGSARLADWTLGNSATMLYHKLCEQHSEDWMERTLQYLSACERFQGTTTRPITPPPPMPPVPTAQWLLSVHAEDVRSRYSELKARVTSVFGSILKMDSTKQVAKKLAGAAAGTATWVTNVGNEHGQVLMSVLTSHEGQGLLPMTTGLVRRYEAAGVASPTLLYVDRDCCSSVGTSRAAAMFSGWSDLVVRLDVWHFMRHFAAGLHTDSHPLYGLFMAKLSACIFVWDEGDVALLREAKRRELEQQQGIKGLTEEQLTGRLTSRQLAQHCRRCTRGVEETEQLIRQMLEAFKDARETMGIPLMDQERMDVIWDTQRRHLPCIQDPPGVQLYTQTGSVTKGGLTLPVYRCARGSTSLESFHNHLNRFIPGTSANLENFQAYLLEGLERWNEDRAAAAVTHNAPLSLRCYSGSLQHSLNELSQRLLGCSLVQDYSKPGQYTGGLIGVEYLCSQQSWEFRENFGRDPDVPDGIPADLGDIEDEGFGDEAEEQDHTISPLSLVSTKEAICLSRDSPSPSQSSQDLPPEPQEDVCRGPDGTPGFDRVVDLARYLVTLREKPCVSDREAADIVRLWDRLPDSDRQGVSYPPRHKERLLQGRFKATHSKTSTCHGKESLKRCVLGQGSGPAQWPNISRIVEAVCLELCSIHPAGKVKWGVSMNRWAAILHDYQAMRRLVGNCPALRGRTRIQLFEVNQRTLSVWKKLEADVLALSVPLPQISMVSHTQLPAARSGHATWAATSSPCISNTRSLCSTGSIPLCSTGSIPLCSMASVSLCSTGCCPLCSSSRNINEQNNSVEEEEGCRVFSSRARAAPSPATCAKRLHVHSMWAAQKKRIWAHQGGQLLLLCHSRGKDTRRVAA